MQVEILRKQLLDLLSGGNAHMGVREAIEDYPMDRINEKFPNGTYGTWALLEHIRITQWDILDFMINPKYREMAWPKDYWPDPAKAATAADWEKSLKAYEKDLESLKAIVKNPKTDLNGKIVWGEGQTILREILLVADHTAYHTGELGIMRQAMKTWRPDHK